MAAGNRFNGKARSQAMSILGFAGAAGTAALVELSTGRVEVAAGVDATALPPCIPIPELPEMAGALADGVIVGRVGRSHAILVWLVKDAGPVDTWVQRLDKACELVERMMGVARGAPVPSAPPSAPPSSAPAEVAAVPPRRGNGKQFEPH